MHDGRMLKQMRDGGAISDVVAVNGSLQRKWTRAVVTERLEELL